MKPNVIFLDFDGVICNPTACVAMNEQGGFSYLDPVAVNLVKRICVETNSKLVISSSWRLGRNLDFFQSILSAVCPSLGNYVWNHQENFRTVSHVFSNDEEYRCNRGIEIKEWVDRHVDDINDFIILDDDSDMEPLMDKHIKCDVYDGLGFSGYLKAINMLGKVSVV